MKEIEVLAAMDWLKQDTRIGVLGYDSIRGTVAYQFCYDADWLREHTKLVLSRDLKNVNGKQYARGRIFSMFQDMLPDRWGRRLIDKRERLLAEQENRVPRHLEDADYLLLLDDVTRMGAFRLKSGDIYCGTEYADYVVPPVSHIREFIDLAHAFEHADTDGSTIREQWLYNLYRQGSSLGGARPKANVRDTDGALYIAKIPSIHDDYDIALWEHFACRLAHEAGIWVADTRLLQLDGQRYHTLLTRRFDRDGERRIHFASAMTLCGLQDGASADTDNGYLDIVDMIIGDSGIADIHAALCELYRRVAFSCLIGNHDDHFRNHGFLLTPKGWEWSPAYDLNPTNMMTQSLLINETSCDSSLVVLLESCQDYMLEQSEAEQIIREVYMAVSQWRKVATRCGITPSEQQRFEKRFEWALGQVHV